MRTRSVRGDLGQPLSVERLEDRTAPAALAMREEPVLPVIDAPMKEHLRGVFLRGQALGARADAFVKVGDSHTAAPEYLSAFGSPLFDPAGLGEEYPGLVGVVARYRAPVAGGNSFTRVSSAAGGGWTALQAFAALPRELAAVRPAVALIMVGHNDQALGHSPEQFRGVLSGIVSFALARGVIPVLSTSHFTLLGRETAGPRIAAFNEVVIEVARAYRVPVLNWWRASEPLPLHGVDLVRGFGVHLSTAPAGPADLHDPSLIYGNNLRNLVTLQVLEKLQRIVFGNGEPDLPLPSGSAPWAPLEPGGAYAVTGAGEGELPVVRVLDPRTGAIVNSFFAYDRSFGGGVRVAMGDVTGDDVADVVTGAGEGGGPEVRVFDGRDGSAVRDFFAYAPDFRGGVNVAVGDVDGNGRDEVVTGAGEGGGPQVRVFRGGSGEVLRDFFAFEPGFRGGVRVAAGDVTGDGKADVIAGAGFGGGPRVAVRDGATGRLASDFFAYAPSVRAGVYVAAGDLDGDGADELITGAAEGGPHVGVFDGRTGESRGGFFADDPALPGGVRVAAVRGADGSDDLLAYSGARVPHPLRLFAGEDFAPLAAVRAEDPFERCGIFVGGSG